MGTVRVGPKGQIVIPKEAREMFGIKPGESLVLLAHPEKGIAIERQSVLSDIAEAIFKGRGREIEPGESEESLHKFAEIINKTVKGSEDSERDRDGRSDKKIR